MIYTEATKTAMRICYKAHMRQFDRDGIPYVFHPIHLAEQMDDENSTVVALLHDVVEDTKCTLEDLKSMGFNEEVLAAIALLTHDKAVPYEEYVLNLQSNPIARKVKLADLRHNSDLTRLSKITENDFKRVEKYKRAIQILACD